MVFLFQSGVLKSDDSDSEDDSGKSDIDKSESVDDEAEAQHKVSFELL